MAKDTAAKELKRAKKKKAARARDQQRNAENRRVAEILLEGMDERTARGLAAVYSIPQLKECSEPRQLRTPAGPHFGDIKRRLDRCGGTALLAKFVDVICETTMFDDAQPAGCALVCPMDEAELVTPIPMPGQLLFFSPDADEWMKRARRANEAAAIAWLVWDFTEYDAPIPVVLAMDHSDQLALWFMDEEYVWHPASQPHRYLQAARNCRAGSFEEAGLGELLEICGVSADLERPLASADDPAAVTALEVVARSQEQLLRAFFNLAKRAQQDEAAFDLVAGENERIGSLERELSKVTRQRAQLEQERDTARRALNQMKAEVHRSTEAPAKAVSLVDRLATVFA
jgi:hypothetical protein